MIGGIACLISVENENYKAYLQSKACIILSYCGPPFILVLEFSFTAFTSNTFCCEVSDTGFRPGLNAFQTAIRLNSPSISFCIPQFGLNSSKIWIPLMKNRWVNYWDRFIVQMKIETRLFWLIFWFLILLLFCLTFGLLFGFLYSVHIYLLYSKEYYLWL